ncbi:MAG TPA: hypothetical protein QF646_06060, partial [Candidatus Poseidoniales archaeon]|nr:hypothetical protein [Candidatus Poseidoniales archaeon]
PKDEESENDDSEDEESEDDDESNDDDSEDGDESENDESDDEESEDDEAELDDERTEKEEKMEASPSEDGEERPTARQRWLLKNRDNVFPILFVLEGIALLVVLVNWFIGLIPFGASSEGERFSLVFWKFIGKTLGFVDEDTTSPGGLNIESLLLLIAVLLAIGGTIYLRKQVMAWHIRFRRKRPKDDEDSVVTVKSEKETKNDEKKSDSQEDDDTDTDEDDDEDDDDDDEDDDDDDEDDDDDDEDDDDDDEDDDDDKMDDDGAVDIGSYVGVDDEDGEFFGTIVEFLDDDDEVVVEREEDGKEITVPFDLIFLGDD